MLLVVKPGEYIHLPKGCSHMFRKGCLEVGNLKKDDCHLELHTKLVEEAIVHDTARPHCVSVAYDWQFAGYTDAGIQREALWSWMACLRNRRNMGVKLCQEANVKRCPEAEGTKEETPPLIESKIENLGQTELALLHVAELLGGSSDQNEPRLTQLKVLRPIIASVISRQLRFIDYAEETAAVQGEVMKTSGTKPINLYGLVTVEEHVPDTKQSPKTACSIVAYNTDFECVYCGIELANCYFHCNVSQV
jgi:hypothetical protein